MGHGHGHGHTFGDEASHPLWQRDRVRVRSLGVDIGSSTTHLVISRLELRRESGAPSSRYEVRSREVEHYSPVVLTPFSTAQSINAPALELFFAEVLTSVGLSMEQIDTGAVITTGDAARKRNAAAVASLFAESLGTFVCAAAGPLLEARMAAFGSGAVARSARVDDTGGHPTVLNIDIGGGTTKFAVTCKGRVVEATAMNVGARLIVHDADGQVIEVQDPAHVVGDSLGLSIVVGKPLAGTGRKAMAERLAECVVEVAARRRLSDVAAKLMIGAPLTFEGPIDEIMFSGGVSEYVYDAMDTEYGDLGRQLAAGVRDEVGRELADTPVVQPSERIRATVIGASQFTVQVSGNTIHVGARVVLPLRNLRAVLVDLGRTPVSVEAICANVRTAMELAEVAEAPGTPFALAIRWPHGPAYAGLQALCTALGLVSAGAPSSPLVLVLDADIARLVGSILGGIIGRTDELICVDGIELDDFDYIDISRPHADAGMVTVAIKSLVFTG